MLECFLAPALCTVGVFSKTVCGVKSHCGSRMENADLQPASVSNTTHVDSGGLEENLSSISPPYPEGRGKASKGISKETELCTLCYTKSASCVGWKTKGKCILEYTGTLSWTEKVNL